MEVKAMRTEIADYLRSKAQQCMMMARSCENVAITTELRAMAHELIRKAAELDDTKEFVQLD
jgi:hypothetical protein